MDELARCSWLGHFLCGLLVSFAVKEVIAIVGKGFGDGLPRGIEFNWDMKSNFKPVRLISRLVVGTFLIAFTIMPSASGQSPADSSSQKSSPNGLQLLHKMQKALGGEERLAAIQDYEETVRAQIWNDSGVSMGQVRKRTRWMRKPSLLRLDQIGPRDTYVLYFDGDSQSGWEILPDMKNPDKFKTTGEAIELTGGELQFAQSYFSGFDLRVWLADRIPGYAVTSAAPNVLRIAHDGTAIDITLDPSTYLPAKSASVSLANPNGPVSAEMHFEGWTKVAGLLFATHRVNYHNGIKLAELTDEGVIRVNDGLTQIELAAEPADFAPVIPSR
jgi:hypothetical protein